MSNNNSELAKKAFHQFCIIGLEHIGWGFFLPFLFLFQKDFCSLLAWGKDVELDNLMYCERSWQVRPTSLLMEGFRTGLVLLSSV